MRCSMRCQRAHTVRGERRKAVQPATNGNGNGGGAMAQREANEAGSLDYAWRFVATGLSFLLFGLCGTAFSLVLFPLAWLWPHRASRQRAVTTLIHLFFRAFVGMLKAIGVMKLEVRGDFRRTASRPAIIVANHPTYLDVMVLLSLLPSACCVVKHAHWRNPCFYGIVRAANYVSNADPLELVEAGAQQLRAGYSMIVFPEGTRSPEGARLHPFSRGFAHMALAGMTGTSGTSGTSGALEADTASTLDTTPIVPVLIDCDPPVFTKTRRWFHIPPRAFCLRVAVLDTVSARQWTNGAEPPALAARALANGLQSHITRHLLEYGFFKTGN